MVGGAKALVGYVGEVGGAGRCRAEGAVPAGVAGGGGLAQPRGLAVRPRVAGPAGGHVAPARVVVVGARGARVVGGGGGGGGAVVTARAGRIGVRGGVLQAVVPLGAGRAEGRALHPAVRPRRTAKRVRRPVGAEVSGEARPAGRVPRGVVGGDRPAQAVEPRPALAGRSGQPLGAAIRPVATRLALRLRRQVRRVAECPDRTRRRRARVLGAVAAGRTRPRPAVADPARRGGVGARLAVVAGVAGGGDGRRVHAVAVVPRQTRRALRRVGQPDGGAERAARTRLPDAPRPRRAVVPRGAGLWLVARDAVRPRRALPAGGRVRVRHVRPVRTR